MPKPLFGDNGSGMHVPPVASGRTASRCSTTRPGYAGLSDMARWYIGGILQHAPSLLAFTNPTVNSYHRLVPGFEAPINLVYSPRNRSACVRIPITGIEPEGQAHRVPGARPVGQPVPRLLGAADGRPRRHQEQDRARRRRSTRTSTSSRRTRWPSIAQVPARWTPCSTPSRPTTSSCIDGGVFTPDLIETWIDYKRANEIDPSSCARTRTSSSCTTTSEIRPLTCGFSEPRVAQSARSPHEPPAPHPRRLVQVVAVRRPGSTRRSSTGGRCSSSRTPRSARSRGRRSRCGRSCRRAVAG